MSDLNTPCEFGLREPRNFTNKEQPLPDCHRRSGCIGFRAWSSHASRSPWSPLQSAIPIALDKHCETPYSSVGYEEETHAQYGQGCNQGARRSYRHSEVVASRPKHGLQLVCTWGDREGMGTAYLLVPTRSWLPAQEHLSWYFWPRQLAAGCNAQAKASRLTYWKLQ